MIYSKNMHELAVGKYDLGIQSVYTPIADIEEKTGFSFGDAIIEGTKEICVLFNTEFFEYFLEKDYIKNNNVHVVFGYDCEYDFNMANRVSRLYKYNNVEFIDLTAFSKSKNVKDIVKVMGQRKFDFVFSNPPYNNNVDLSILETIYQFTKNIIFIHPASWILSKFSDSDRYIRLRNLFKNHVVYVNLFWGNDIFDIRVKNALAITHISQNIILETKVDDNLIIQNHRDSSKYITEFDNITWHGLMFKQAWTEFDTFRNLVKLNGTLLQHTCLENKIEEFGYQIGKATGDDLPQWWGIYFMLNLDHDKSFRTKNSNFNKWKKFIWNFKTKNEQINFDNFLKTKFIRFYTSFFKTNIDLNSCKIFERIPWMDFTRSWNDAKLCKEFNISKELWKYIDKFIPDYYDDYKSGFETCRLVTPSTYDNPSQDMIDFCGDDIVKQLLDKPYDKRWHSKVFNGAYIKFQKDNKKYTFQKSINQNTLCENSKYRDRVNYSLYEIL